MKLLNVHVEKSLIRLALVNHRGKTSHIEKLRSFDLPENLTNNLFMNEPESLANFIVTSINKSNIGHKRVAVLFGSGPVIHREYSHAPGNKSQLIAIADTEAESLLPNDDFIVENLSYGNVKTNQDMAISSIFAISDSFTLTFVNSLKRSGIKVAGVYSTLHTYKTLADRLLASGFAQKNFSGDNIAFIDISCDETRTAIFSKGRLIHQRLDDHYIEEACKVASEVFLMPMSSVRALINSGEITEGEATGELSGALRTAFSRLIRSLNVTLGEFDLSLDGIVITGDGANFQPMAGLIEEVSEVKTLAAIDFYDEVKNIIGLSGELRDRKDLYQNLLLLAGVNKVSLKSVNFILRGIKRKKSKRITVFVSTILLILALLVMALQPINLFISNQNKNALEELLSTDKYQEIEKLLDQHRILQNELDSVEYKLSALPFGQSHVAVDLSNLKTTMFDGNDLTHLTYDMESEKYLGLMVFANPDEFVNAKNRINRRSDFQMNYPLRLYSSGNTWNSDFEVKLLQENGGK